MVRKELNYWRLIAVDTSISPVSDMIVEVYLDCSEISAAQVLALQDSALGRQNRVKGFGYLAPQHTITTGRRSIVLESWKLSLL